MRQDEKKKQMHDIKATPPDDFRLLGWPTPGKEGVVISSERGVVDVEDSEDHKGEESKN